MLGVKPPLTILIDNLTNSKNQFISNDVLEFIRTADEDLTIYVTAHCVSQLLPFDEILDLGEEGVLKWLLTDRFDFYGDDI